ncbi:hypothetical protein GCM10010082_19870 [Kushneria pakistanensis]|uniref:DUF4136 domain-containing protein n=1 Tax=Kushneria pakistanensis TaxID=1508770 RepID=A0ABQ3FK59_9GAMM|nr:hypothetical protein [Kushneria pakistanensis]GHC26677.1 hypothetical protein GCM10010082_19870 [Kushneria pakistanensis]
MKRIHKGGMKGLGVALLLVVTVGCATTTSLAPPERLEHFNASSDQLMQATMASLAERGFVIVYGDHALGDIRASYAARPEWRVEAHIEDSPRGSELQLRGWRGRSALAVGDLDRLTTAIAERLGEGPLSGPGVVTP